MDWYERLKKLYPKRCSKAMLKKAVTLGWITAEQYKEITGEEYTTT